MIGIVDVQQFMLTSVKQIVNVLQFCVLIAVLQCILVVCIEDTGEALCLACICSRRLSAAADAAVGTSHDFHEVELLFLIADLRNQFIGIAEAVCNCNTDGQITCSDFECLDTVQTTDTAFSDSCHFGIGGGSKDAADNSFGNAAGNSEDNAAAGVHIQRLIRFRIGQ